MKSVLLHVYEDGALDARLQVALDFCRAHDAHLTCLHVTPYNAYVAFDPLGGAFTQGAVMDELRKLDHVGYVRFASVYRSFEDVADFREELDRLERELPGEGQLSLLGEGKPGSETLFPHADAKPKREKEK